MERTVLAPDIEIIVVANGCTDETENYIKTLGESFVLVSNPKPLGYPRAINLGLSVAQGEEIVLLNNDIVMMDWGRPNEWLEILRKPFSDPNVGIAGPAKTYWGKYPLIIFFCVMIRSKLFYEIGYLDTSFGHGAGEDTDFCIKSYLSGWKVVQVPVDHDHMEGGKFPIWHKAEQTVHTLPDWEDSFKRNTKLLLERYPRSDLYVD